MKLTNAKVGGELAIVRVSDAPPAMLAYLAELGLAAETRLTVRKHRSNSAVMTIQIRGQHEAIHLGSVASDALWVESTAA
jgi:Fe2+ transport system protein FeoA